MDFVRRCKLKDVAVGTVVEYAVTGHSMSGFRAKVTNVDKGVSKNGMALIEVEFIDKPLTGEVVQVRPVDSFIIPKK